MDVFYFSQITQRKSAQELKKTFKNSNNNPAVKTTPKGSDEPNERDRPRLPLFFKR